MADRPLVLPAGGGSGDPACALERRAFVLVTALVAIAQGTTSVFVPAMPAVAAALETDAAAVNLTLSLYLFGFAVSQLVYGPLSDRLGRRPVLIGGLGLYVVATLFCAVAPTIEALVAGRLLQGLTVCVGPVVGRAVIRDVFPRERSARVLAHVGMAMAATPALAPLLGGVLEEVAGWRAIFVALMLAAVVLIVALVRLLPETSPKHGDTAAELPRRGPRLGELAAAWRTLMGAAEYWGYTLAVALIFAALMAYTAGVPFVIIALLGLSPATFGALAAVTVLGYVAGSILCSRMTVKLGIDRLMLLGLVLSTVGSTVMAGLGFAGIFTVVAVIGPMLVFSTGLGMVLATGIAGAMAPFPAIAGAASALLGFLQMTFAALGALAVGAFAPTSQVPMATVMTVATVGGSLAYFQLVWRRRSA